MTAPDPRAVGAVAVGGATGAVLRWGLGELLPAAGGFPWTTFAINVTGSFALALVLASPAVRRRPVLLAGLGPGLLGGYTTLSAWAEESRALLADGDLVLVSAYLVATVAACAGAVAAASMLTARRG